MLVGENTILTYTNERGLSITLTPLTDFFLADCIENIDNNIISQKIRGLDGENFSCNTLSPRRIEVIGFFNRITNRREMERTLKRVFHMGIEGELRCTAMKGSQTFSIKCRVENFPEVTFIDGTVEFSINLVCFSPYWRGESKTEHISMVNKCGRFPLVIPKDTGFIFGYKMQTLKTTFENIGDAVAGAVYTLKADGGTVTNPSITHENTGSTIKVFHTLQENEKLVITSIPDFVGIQIYKNNNTVLNGMPYLLDDTRRKFFMLDFGENTISYDAEKQVTNLSVSATYTPLYLEVF